MLTRLRPRSAYDVMAALALFLVLTGGTALAAHETIFSDDIVDGEVQNQDLAADSVSTSKIQTQGVITGDLAPNSVTSSRIPDEAVGTSEIAQGSVFNADLAANSITDTRIAADAVGSSELKPDSVGSPEVVPDSLNHGDVQDFHRFESSINDSMDDANPVEFVADTIGPFTVMAGCFLDTPNTQAYVRIRSDFSGWAMDTEGDGAQDQVGLAAGAAGERALINIGPASVSHYRHSTFSVEQGGNRISGEVGMRLAPGGSCPVQYTRFGP